MALQLQDILCKFLWMFSLFISYDGYACLVRFFNQPVLVKKNTFFCLYSKDTCSYLTHNLQCIRSHRWHIEPHILVWFTDFYDHGSFASEISSPFYCLICSFYGFNSPNSLIFNNDSLSYIKPAHLFCNLPAEDNIFPFILRRLISCKYFFWSKEA